MLNFRSLIFIASLLFADFALGQVVQSEFAQAKFVAQKNVNKCQIEPQPGLVVERVYGANPIVTYLLMTLAPDTIIGWNFEPPKEARGIFPDASFAKPVVGGWFGQGRVANVETLLKEKPQLLIMSDVTVDLNHQQTLLKLGLPTCYLTLDHVHDYPQAFRDLGKWLNRSEKAEQLASLAEKWLAEQDARLLELEKRQITPKTVYYAQTPAGLSTECRGSIHAEVVELAGGVNPHICPKNGESNRFGMVEIGFEQLATYNPGVIVTQERAFFDKVYQDPKWKKLPAVQNNQVIFMPQTPFRWIDRPPSYMRLLGMQVLMEKLYPNEFDYQIEARVKEFFAVAFEKNLTDEQVKSILAGGGL